MVSYYMFEIHPILEVIELVRLHKGGDLQSTWDLIYLHGQALVRVMTKLVSEPRFIVNWVSTNPCQVESLFMDV